MSAAEGAGANGGGAGGVDFLAHDAGDHVAVAVRDVAPGEATVGWLSSPERRSVQVSEPVPFGHKVALAALGDGEAVVEYGVPVAVTTKAVTAGSLVHTHNVRSTKWQSMR
ncbi:MAG: UxaA family hydrolase [Actinomycetota bacterium]|nr:UxaA family hydrolase [Actinomycetota bacterium]